MRFKKKKKKGLLLQTPSRMEKCSQKESCKEIFINRPNV